MTRNFDLLHKLICSERDVLHVFTFETKMSTILLISHCEAYINSEVKVLFEQTNVLSKEAYLKVHKT